MAVTAVVVARDATSRAIRVVDLTLDNSYPTNGWQLSAQMLGLGTNGVIQEVNAPDVDGYRFEYIRATGKLKAFQGDNPNGSAAPGIEVTNASAALNAKVVRLNVAGLGQG